MSKLVKVWITKYALSQGIFEMTAEVDGKYADGKHKGYQVFTAEFARTRSEALTIAEEMRTKRIASLKKQIDKLEKMVIE